MQAVRMWPVHRPLPPLPLRAWESENAAVMTESTWALDPQLARDSVAVGDLALCRVLLANDAHYPWLILVPRKPGLTELTDLEENAQAQLLGEIDACARALKNAGPCDKLNIAALGNQVAQLHVHVIARRKNDAAWPQPVWGVMPPQIYDPAVRDKLIAALRRALHVTPVGG
jgi:diadenosine tetraphosphate (Ap4A) HIT family hydrolase